MSNEAEVKGLVQGRKEVLLSAMCCQEQTCFAPENAAQCMAQKQEQLACCVISNGACCIMQDHPDWAGMTEGQDGSCFCASKNNQALVKPLCLTGEKPLFSMMSEGGCQSQRAEFPVKDLVCC